MDYETLKSMAKEEKCSVEDLLVLSPGNDPYYVGSKGQREKAEWFAQIYEEMGSPYHCHVRRVHYFLVSPEKRKEEGITSKKTYKKPDGSTYMNTDKDWGYILLASKYARYLGLVPVENIVDRRNPAPHINAHFWENEVPSETKGEMDAAKMIEMIAESFLCFNPATTQRYLLEIWCEKSTMDDVLLPICQRKGMNLVTGLGELSITAVNNLAKRISEANKPVRIFYISDFDPAGECMPVSIGRKIQYFADEESLDGIRLKQIALTPEQCQKYDLPRIPIKDTEKRKQGFQDRHGIGATELDALEALYPGELAGIVEAELEPYFDAAAWNKAQKLNVELQETVTKFLEKRKDEFQRIENDLLKDLDLTTYDEVELPFGDEVDDGGENWLYDSDLSYKSQVQRFKEFKTRTR